MEREKKDKSFEQVLVYHTFFNNTPFLVQHALNFTASDIHQASLLNKRLSSVKLGAIGLHGTHRDQEADVVLPQT